MDDIVYCFLRAENKHNYWKNIITNLRSQGSIVLEYALCFMCPVMNVWSFFRFLLLIVGGASFIIIVTCFALFCFVF